MVTSVHTNGASPPGPMVVPAFNGESERFILRTVRLFRRSLAHANGDAGIILGKHLRTRIPAGEIDKVLADLAALFVEIHFIDGHHLAGRTAAKWSNKQEFFLIAMFDASQRGDTARATEAAIALLDTFNVRDVLEASRRLARTFQACGLMLMPVGAAAFSYFADYKAVEDNTPLLVPGSFDAALAPLRLIAS